MYRRQTMEPQMPFTGRNAVPYLVLWRASKGYSMKALAERAGVSISTILHAEHGARLTMANTMKIARALEITIDQLLHTRPAE